MTKRALIKQATVRYLHNSTIHGLPFFVQPKLHLFERFFWGTLAVAAITASVAMTMYTYRRFSANPTVVSMKKDFRNWNNPFPAVTGCLLDRVDEAKAYDFIMSKWNVNATNPNFEFYMNYVKAVANISYATMFDLSDYEENRELNDIDMAELAMLVHPDLTGTLMTVDGRKDHNWTLVMTEFGLCFTLNSKFAPLLNPRKQETKQIMKYAEDFEKSQMMCHYLNGLCYAKYDSDPLQPIKFFIHSPLDIVDATANKAQFVFENQEVEINYRMQETASDLSISHLTPSQRRCRYYNEPIDEVPLYSTSLCYIACRNRLIMKICGCRPFFYHYLDGKMCNISGLLCIAYQSEFLVKSPLEVGCECPQPCEIIAYLPEIPKVQIWKSGYFDERISFRWGLLAPTTKYHRDILFSFEDLVVSFGGISALCLGVSFLSLIEFFLYLIECVLILCGVKIFKDTNGKIYQRDVGKRRKKERTENTTPNQISNMPSRKQKRRFDF